MNTKSVNVFALSLLTLLLPVMSSRGQTSAYSNAVVNLNPVCYWPLQETTQPPGYDIETNYGSLGSVANMYYASTNAVHVQPGAISGDGDTAINFIGNTSSFGVVPTTDNRVSLTTNQPFSVECWVRATGGQSFVAMVSQTGPNNSGGLNGSTNASGWLLGQNYAQYRGTSSGNNPPCFSFHAQNNVGMSGGAEVEITNNMTWLTGGTSGYQNSWVYLAGVFDGTNCWLYVYSTNLDNTTYGGTNSMSLQLPITTAPGAPVGGPGTPIPGAAFSPDTWDPIEFGCNRGLGANPYHGYVDEVAIYTNALTFAQITNHFTAGTNSLGNYSATIMADNPYMYWRMDAPKWTPPAPGSLPAAANYGSAASGMTNYNTAGNGANSAVYQPGTVPGVSGPSSVGFGNLTNACAFNGLVGVVDVGYNKLIDPTDVTNNFTLVAWFKGNPMDYNGNRWQALASHTDSSWKAQFRGGTTFASKGAGSQASIAPTTFNANDGNWHMYVLESTYTNGVSTNLTVYLDNGRISSTIANPSPILGKPASDAWIGGAPDASYIEPTNEAAYNANQQYFAGKVAHVAYFTNALTASQIQALYYTAVPAPVVLTQPVSATVNANSAFTNTVIIGGAPPLSYQWYNNGVAINGATNASLVFNPVLPGNASIGYYVVATNIYGAVSSAVVSLTVLTSVSIVAQFPTTYTNTTLLYGGGNIGGTNYFGSTPTFSVSAAGAQPIHYQWMTNNVAVGGATNASFTLTNCQMTSPNNFSCVVTNIDGAATTTPWLVTYIPASTAPYPRAILAGQPLCYWRLNETNDNGLGNAGVVCHDYQSGNNAIFTNVYIGTAVGYSQLTDPTETATEFGYFALTGCFAGQIGTNIDFSAPAGSNAEFSVVCWANGTSLSQPGNAGLVAKGYFNGEEFSLDEGGPGSDLRFEVRNAAGTAYNANTAINLGADSYWHLVVGICDQANSSLSIWVDGLLATNIAIPAGSGIFNSSSVPVMIGARSSNAGTPGNNQFKGYLNDVAIFNYALSAGQISAIYPGQAPSFVDQPVANTNVDQGGTLTVPTTVSGTMPMSFHWYNNVYATPGAIPGQTNATLVISNVTANDYYYLVVTNVWGATTSSVVAVNVYSGAPNIMTDVNNPFFGFPGGTAVNSVQSVGSLPMAYQWQFSSSNTVGWVKLQNNSRISGAQGSSLTISNLQPADMGNYQVVVSNSFGSANSSVATLTIPGVLPLTFYDNTANGWTGNGSARFSAGTGTLSLTDPNNGGGTGSFFFQVPQYIGAFNASFIYQAGGNMAADGVTFCLQDDARGPAADGGGGGQLGYGGIQPSVALELNIYSGNGVGGVGYSVNAYGTVGPTTPPGAIVLNNGDPISVTVNYAKGVMSLMFTDMISSVTFSTNVDVGDITQILGYDTAYVGFTGAYGGLTSVQTISGFTFVSIPPADIEIENHANALVLWPGSVLGYTVQQNSDLTTTNWLNMTNQVVLTNGVNQVAVPRNAGNQFYRLILPQ